MGIFQSRMFLFRGLADWNVYLWMLGAVWEQASPEGMVYPFVLVRLSGCCWLCSKPQAASWRRALLPKLQSLEDLMDDASVRIPSVGEKNRSPPRQGNFTYGTLGCPKHLF
ncbi:unnamed protein product [Rangifer tarandus platyrhynchus]|uniref:Uncharacterized protein n=3 Tax=Rangifer tarandus platyrhynchus TaxID=3082113 RepID=A0ABN8Y578_RANTA|nr:unnamed protein product [Rangifer tarandus platyrhynchus]CAI9694863.1 unnamed protein product [Rangifer tarandus platyrhynchus]